MNQYSRPASPTALRDFCFPSSPFFQIFPVIIYFGINPLGITVTGFDTRRCMVFTLCKTAHLIIGTGSLQFIDPKSEPMYSPMILDEVKVKPAIDEVNEDKKFRQKFGDFIFSL